MLAIHWTPVGNTRDILKNGIRKSKKGLFCFPLTGFKQLDDWWVKFFNHGARGNRKKYNGIVFRIKDEDFPARFGHWLVSNQKPDFVDGIADLKTLTRQYRETVLWRMREEMAEAETRQNSQAVSDKLNSLDFMTFAFEDYQIILSHSIAPERILKVISTGRLKNSREKSKERLPTE